MHIAYVHFTHLKTWVAIPWPDLGFVGTLQPDTGDGKTRKGGIPHQGQQTFSRTFLRHTSPRFRRHITRP